MMYEKMYIFFVILWMLFYLHIIWKALEETPNNQNVLFGIFIDLN